MILKISYFDNRIEFKDDYINVVEIENKKYFYRFVNDLFDIMKNGFSANLDFFDSNGIEKNINGKLKLYLDYFNFYFDSKKNLIDITKYVSSVISEEDKNLLQNQFKKIVQSYKKILNDIDFPIAVEENINIDSLSKLLKTRVEYKEELLDNLLILIDIEKTFNLNNILVFINLKQYLSQSELIELYKYSIYNKVQILLIDSQSYGGTLEYEKKLIIDEDLDEFVL